ncbi:cytidylyltransferase domain-containing protein [Fusibacter sp. JL216-2]|uniref:acylneuraminate cytidylyltransferase family protein n=1 Tax=Fusibacter sp. JL216-2 TaxID=3071453 RepID=UPI003D35244B
MSNIVAIIPARGGSKGVEKKNIRSLLGKPLIFYTIEAALESCVDRVIVSTDDPEIAKIAESYGAEIPFIRPKEYAEDNSSSLSVIQHALSFLEDEGDSPDIVVFLQPTSPLRTYETINESILMLKEANVDSVIGVQRVYESHPYFMFTENENQELEEYVKIENKPSRRQDVPPCYLINSALYVSKRSYFRDLDDNAYVFNINSVKGYVMDRVQSIDINDIVDFHLAEKLMHERYKAFGV